MASSHDEIDDKSVVCLHNCDQCGHESKKNVEQNLVYYDCGTCPHDCEDCNED